MKRRIGPFTVLVPIVGIAVYSCVGFYTMANVSITHEVGSDGSRVRETVALNPEPEDDEHFVERNTIPRSNSDDVPRNQSSIDLRSLQLLDFLPHRANASSPSDAILMPITGAGERGENKNARKTGFVYSAFLDPRFETGPFVRVLGVIHMKVDELFCLFHWPAANPRSVVQAKVEMQRPLISKMPEHQYFAVHINCPLNAPNGLKNRDLLPTSVSIVPDQESWKTSHPGNNVFVHCGKFCGDPVPDPPPIMTFCPRTLVGNYSDLLQLVEFLEFHAILGFEHFYLYGHSYSKQVECVIQGYYQNESIPGRPNIEVDFRNWELPFHLPAELDATLFLSTETTGNDCFFRSLLSGAEFVAINADLDELLVPANYFSVGLGALTRLMRHLSMRNPRAGSFSFKRIQFPRHLPDDVGCEQSANLTKPEIEPRWLRKTMTINHDVGIIAPRLIHVPDGGAGVGTLLDGYERINVDPETEGRCHDYKKLDHARQLSFPLKDSEALRANATDRTTHAYEGLLKERIETFLKNVPKNCNVTANVWNKDEP